MAIPDIYLKAAGGVISFLAGAFATRWWDRARPLVVLNGFDTVLRSPDEVDCPAKLEEMSEESWHMRGLVRGKRKLGQVWQAMRASLVAKHLFAQAIEDIPKHVSALENAQTDNERVSAIKEMISSTAINESLNMALARQELHPDPFQPSGRVLIEIDESEDDGGCFRVIWRDGTTNLGSGLKSKSYLKTRLKPLLDAVREGHIDAIVGSLRKLEPLVKRQLDIHNEIISICKPLTEQNQQWAAEILVANYGAGPMIIWPTANLLIKHKALKARFKIPCYVALIEDKGKPGNANDLEGFNVLAPGTKASFYVLTRQPQQGISNGTILRSHFESGDAYGRIVMNITRRGAPFSKRSKSNWSLFRSHNHTENKAVES